MFCIDVDMGYSILALLEVFDLILYIISMFSPTLKDTEVAAEDDTITKQVLFGVMMMINLLIIVSNIKSYY